MQLWITILWKVGPPLLAALLPKSPITPMVLAAVEAAERAGGSGAEKKARALELVDQSAANMRIGSAAAVPSPKETMDTASSVIDAIVSTVNAWTAPVVNGTIEEP